MRMLRTTDLARLFFGATGTCQKRMRKLFDAGLVRTVVTDLAAENRYVLSRLGHSLLIEALDDDADVPIFRQAPRIDSRSVRHLDLLNQYRIALAEGCSTADSVELVRFTPEWDLRSSDPQAPIVPDAIMILALPSGRRAFALEIDTGSEPPATVAKKVARYDEAAMLRRPIFGVVNPLITIVAANPRRARNLARALATGSGARHVRLGAPPIVLRDGGVSSGFSSVLRLARADGNLGDHAFTEPLAA